MKTIKDTYNQIAGELTTGRRPAWPEMKRLAGEVKTGERVLDIGCGEGRLLDELTSGVNYTGIDFSERLIGEAEKRHQGQRLLVGDLREEKVWKGLGEFDYVFAVAVIHHLINKREQAEMVRRIKSVLKPGGKLILSWWDLWQGKFLATHFNSIVEKIIYKNMGVIGVPFRKSSVKRLYVALGKSYVTRLVQEGGLKVVGIQKSGGNYWVEAKVE